MPQPLLVLIAEDNPADAELVLRELRRAGYEPDWHRVDMEAEYLDRLSPDLDIILSDFAMPQFGGLRALELLQARGLDVPFIIISGTIGEDTAVAAMKQGAADYLLKDRLTRLGQAVSHALEQARLRKESKRAGEQLRASEQLFSSAFKYAAIGVALVALNGRYLKVNRAFCQMLGYPEAALLGGTFQDISHPDDLAANLEQVRQLLAGAIESFQMEKRYLHQRGHLVWGLLSVSLVRGEEGDPVHFIAQVQDITERKRAEAALRASEERLRLITNLVPHGIFAKDAAGRYLFANRALAEVCGLPLEEVLGKTDFDLLADQAQAEAYRADDRAVIESGLAKFIPEEPITDFAGHTRFLQTTKIPFTVPETGERAVLGVWVDITERKRTEARFRRLVDSNAQGVMFSKTNGEIAGANDAFLRLVGYSREDLEAGRMNWVAMTPPEYAGRDRHCMEEIAAQGACTPFEKEYLRKDGSRVPVLIGATDFEDNPEEGVCFVLDLTERKQLEQQFLRAQRMESIGTLAAGVAHDLNNILSPIMMSVPLLRRDLTAEQRDGIISTIEMSAERGAQIVRQVLTFGRGLEGERCPLPFGALIEELMKIMRGTFPKDITVESSIGSGLWPVLGDATQLHQVLLNLCVNARDAMPEGGKLRLQAANLDLDASYASMVPEATPGPHVLLEVSDTGSGIPPEIVERIFDPFFTTKGVGQGTGLGLSTTLGIVKSHGGCLQVKTQPGQGTTFQVYLPASPDREAAPAAPARAPLPESHGELVLVVDDEASVRDAARLVLETAGYRVLSAADGTEALAVFAMNSGSVAAVLTDLMMPFMDGVALIRALRTMAPTVPVIASTGLGEKTQLAALKALGVETALHKPYRAETLLRTIHEALHPAASSPTL